MELFLAITFTTSYRLSCERGSGWLERATWTITLGTRVWSTTDTPYWPVSSSHSFYTHTYHTIHTLQFYLSAWKHTLGLIFREFMKTILPSGNRTGLHTILVIISGFFLWIKFYFNIQVHSSEFHQYEQDKMYLDWIINSTVGPSHRKSKIGLVWVMRDFRLARLFFVRLHSAPLCLVSKPVNWLHIFWQ